MTDLVKLPVSAALHLTTDDTRRIVDAIEAADASNTRRAYAAALKKWRQWLDSRGLDDTEDPSVIAAYLLERLDGGAKWSTVRVSIAAISKSITERGGTPPTAIPAFKRTMRGARRKFGVGQKGKDAAVASLVSKMADAASFQRENAVRARTLILVGFVSACRSDELASIQWTDCRRDDNGWTIRITRSKTDQEGVGRDVVIPMSPTANYCAVRALDGWRIESGGEGRVFAMTTRSIRRIVKRAAERAGVEGDISAHSLRIGFVTEAFRNDATERAVMNQTGHTSPATVHRYNREANLWRDPAAGRVSGVLGRR